jgi:hypothetical protein
MTAASRSNHGLTTGNRPGATPYLSRFSRHVRPRNRESHFVGFGNKSSADAAVWRL